MKRIFLQYLALGVIVVFSAACEKIIDYNYDSTEEGIAVGCVINPDSLFSVHLSQSISIIDNSEIQDITDMEVDIFEDDVFIETLTHVEEGNYTSNNFYPSEGKTYKLKINAGDEISATSIIPEPVQVTRVDTSHLEAANWFTAQLTFTDPEGVSNYYRASIRQRAEVYIFENNVHVYTASISQQTTIDPRNSSFLNSMGILADGNPIDELIINKYIIFSDLLIDGQTHTLNLKTPYYFPEKIENVVDNIDPGQIPDQYTYFIDWYLDIYLLTLSEDYFLYLKSKNLHDVLSNNIFFEPMGIISNINNGIGIFGSYASSKKSFPVVINNKYNMNKNPPD